jgi:signal transduction histidine kinase
VADAPYVSKQGAIDTDRQMLRATRGFFEGRSTWLVAVVGLSFIAVVGVLDYLTGPNLSLSLLYLMPIGLVTWNLGRRWGAFVVVVATLAGLASDLLSVPKSAPIAPSNYWDAVVRFAVFMAFAMLLDTLRDIIDDQWSRVERETERAGDLRELNAQKDTLLHAVSHDLKSPLAGIIGAMQTIRRDAELHLTNDERESLYEVIEQSGRKMNRLIDDLLDLDRIDRGQLRPQRRPTDMGELVRRIVREGNGFGAHPIRIEADPVAVEIDPVKVERVVDNLLINATRHTPSGTPIFVHVIAHSDGVLLVVEDEGPGVPDELKEVLFEPFRQGDESGGRGVGIGLSLVERFAELHGGSARIEDRDGGGARFVIDLPGRVTPLRAHERDLLETVALAGSGS